MATAKIYIPEKVYKNGTTPIILQITVDRVAYRDTICSVLPDHIDRKNNQIRKGHENHIVLNKKINRKLSEAKAYILDCEENHIPIDPLRFMHTGRTGDDIISHVKQKYDALIADDKHRTAGKYKTVMSRVEEAKMNRRIHQVNMTWIKEFDKHLKKAGNGPNTRAKYIAALGSVFKQAKDDKVIMINPFEDFKKTSSPSTKQKLNRSEFQAIENVILSGRTANARDLWVFAARAWGMRSHDVLTLKWTAISNGRLKYTSQKNQKDFDILITPELQAILDRQPRAGEYVFPFVTIASSEYKKDPRSYLRHIDSNNSIINKELGKIAELAGIKKHITLHVARHTFAFLSDQKNMSMGTLQQLLGHSKMTTTIGYAESVRKSEELDEASKDVFG